MKLSEGSISINQRGSIKARLSTNTLSHRTRVQRWANFIAGYSIEFVEQCLLTVDKNCGPVLDPFLGCGTTLVAAKNSGFRGIGYDRHPVFFSLAHAKLKNHTSDDLEFVTAQIKSSKNGMDWSPDARVFLEKMFESIELEVIGQASAALQGLPERLKPLGTLLFLRSCEAACGSQTDGIYKAPTSKKRSIPFFDAIDIVASELLGDIQADWYQDHWIQQPEPLLFHKSSTSIDEIATASVNICITSPPYLNNFDYAEMTRMHLYLLGWASNWGEISRTLRNELITNTTTALQGKKSSQYQTKARDEIPAALLPDLDKIVDELRIERGSRAGKKDYDYLVYLYYAEVSKVLSGIFRALRPGGAIHWVVADAALYGVHIKTHDHTSEIMKYIGFEDVVITKMRSRGNRWILSKRDGAKEGLGEYHISAVKRERDIA